VDVEGYPFDLAQVTLPNHPDRPDLGSRTVTAGPSFFLPRRDLAAHAGEEIRLKDLLNVRLDSEVAPSSGAMRAVFTSRENRKLPRLQWVAAEGPVPVDLLGLEGDHSAGLGEGALAAARPGDIVQFERVGFVRVDSDWAPGSVPLRVVYGHP
jgi:glutamyl-tRNA synthetase